jgi:hypothetical protein
VRTVGRFAGNLGVATDPRVTIRVVDGRHLLLRDPSTWDVITLEPPPPTAAGVVNLYSRDFYELCRDRLAPGGIMAQWFPLSTQNEEDARALVRSFVDVFPHASLWTTEAHETLLVGSLAPLVIDARTIAARFAEPEVRRVLAEVGIADPAALLATYVTDRAGLEAFVAGAPPVTDDRPRLEHAGLLRAGEFSRVLERISRCSASRRSWEPTTISARRSPRRARTCTPSTRRCACFTPAGATSWSPSSSVCSTPRATIPTIAGSSDREDDQPLLRWKTRNV